MILLLVFSVFSSLLGKNVPKLSENIENLLALPCLKFRDFRPGDLATVFVQD